MIDLSLQGIKCRAVRDIRSYQGMVSASTEGIIQYELENLGRHLVNVHWRGMGSLMKSLSSSLVGGAPLLLGWG